MQNERWTRKACLAGVLLIAVCTASQAQFSKELVSPERLAAVGYQKYWDMTLPVGGEGIRWAYLLDENLYFVASSGRIVAVHADTGVMRWVVDLDEHIVREHAPSHLVNDAGDGPVVFATHSRVQLFDRRQGSLVADISLPSSGGGGAVAAGSSVFLGTSHGLLQNLHWADGGAVSGVAWEARVRGSVTSQPVLKFGRLYAVSDGGVVYCVRPSDKRLLWAYSVRAEVAGGLHVDESGVYFAGTDRNIHVLDTDTGERIRRYLLPGPLFDTPTVVQRTLYQYCPGEGLFTFDVDSRERMWQNRLARRFVARAAEHLVLEAESGDLMFVDNNTGSIERILRLPDDARTIANERDAVIYLFAADGRVLCAAPDDYPYLRRDDVIQARAGLTEHAHEAAARPGGMHLGLHLHEIPGDPFRSSLDR